MDTATLIKDNLPDFRGEAKLYRLTPPLRYKHWRDSAEEEVRHCEYVVVSGIDSLFGGSETYIFASDANGEVIDWHELPGSFEGDINHEWALRGAGYAVQPDMSPVNSQ